jgi:hypothetical protein
MSMRQAPTDCSDLVVAGFTRGWAIITGPDQESERETTSNIKKKERKTKIAHGTKCLHPATTWMNFDSSGCCMPLTTSYARAPVRNGSSLYPWENKEKKYKQKDVRSFVKKN